MKLAFAFVAPLLMAAALAGCGFKPMYAPASGGAALIGPVTVPEVSGKSGHVYRTELVRLLGGERSVGGQARRLETTVVERVAELGLRVDESATRADLTLVGTYALFDVDGHPLVNGVTTAVVSYDIPISAFGAAAAQSDARERAGVMLAQRVRTELALKLQRARTQPASAPATQTLPAPAPAEPVGLPESRNGPLTSPQVIQPPQ